MCKLFSIFQKGVSVSVFALLLTCQCVSDSTNGSFLECSVKMCKVALEVYRKHFVLWVLCCRALKDMAVCEEGSVCVLCLTDKNRMQAH